MSGQVGALLGANPWGLSVQGPLRLPLPVLAREEVVSPASLMKVAAVLYRSARQPEAPPPATSLEGCSVSLQMVMTCSRVCIISPGDGEVS